METDYITPSVTLGQIINSDMNMLIPPMVNHTFSRYEELGRIRVYRRLGHVHDGRINNMSKLQIINDLPMIKSKKHVYHKARCWIHCKGSTVNIPKEITQSTADLRPGLLLHMNFCFI